MFTFTKVVNLHTKSNERGEIIVADLQAPLDSNFSMVLGKKDALFYGRERPDGFSMYK